MVNDIKEHDDEHILKEIDEADSGLAALARSAQKLFVLLRILMVVLVLSFFLGASFGLPDFGGLFTISKFEEGLLFRFGKHVPVTNEQGQTRDFLKSGRFYWRWPYPVDELVRISTQRPVKVQCEHFWPERSAEDFKQVGLDRASPVLTPGKDGYVVTGDANIVHFRMELVYRVTDSKRHYTGFYSENDDRRIQFSEQPATENRKQMVLFLLEEAVLHEAAGWSVDDLLSLSRSGAGGAGQGQTPNDVDFISADREAFNDSVKRRLRVLVDQNDMGIKIEWLNISGIQPPNATLEAFRRVNDTANEYQNMMKNAQMYQTEVVNQARSKAEEVLADAQTYKVRTLAKVASRRDYFEKILTEYKKNPESMLIALYTEALREVLATVRNRYVLHTRDNGRQEVRILVGPKPEKFARDEDDDQQERR